MNLLQAAMRDKSAKTWRERKTMYKVGSPMKGCHYCGDVEEDEVTGRRCYTSGFQVFRAYRPWETKWTWKCWECGATDLACWENDGLGLVEQELGKEPLLGNRDAVAEKKVLLRRAAMKLAAPRDPEKVARIKELEERLATLMKGATK